MSFSFLGTSFKGWGDDGLPLVGGKLYTYISGTTTPKATYSDAALSVANTNPIILDARGEAQVRLDSGAYTFVLKTPGDVQVGQSQDGISDGSEEVDQLRADLLDSDIGARIVQYSEGTTVYDRLQRSKNPIDDFGAVGDGSTDDTAAISSALNSGFDIDGCGYTYAVSTTITVTAVNRTFRNLRIQAIGGTLNATTPAFTITGANNTFDTLLFDGGKFAAGFNCVAGRTVINNAEIRHFKGYGVCHNSGGSGDMRLTNSTVYEYSSGDTEFATDANFTAECLQIKRADSMVFNCVLKWAKTNLHFYDNGNTAMVDSCHLYNGGSNVLVRDHPRIIIHDAGASGNSITNCYLDDGCTDLYSPDIIFWGNKCIWSNTRSNIDYWIGVYANGQSGPYQLRAGGWKLTSPGLSDGTIPFFHFMPYLTHTWDGDYTHYESSPGVHEVSENINIGRLQVDEDPVMRLFTPAGAGIGCGLTLNDSQTTNTDDTKTPGIWSAGDLLQLHNFGENILNLSATTTLAVSDSGKLVLCDTSGGAFTVKIPATALKGWKVRVRQTLSAVNAVTVALDAGGSIVAPAGAVAPFTTTANLDTIEAIVVSNPGTAPVVHLTGNVT